MKDGILGLGVMATYPWVCLAIRGNKSCLCLTTNRQKNLGQKNGFARNCAPQFQTAIFLPFYLFAFPLVAAFGHNQSTEGPRISRMARMQKKETLFRFSIT